MESNGEDYLFRVEDYIILAILLLLSVGVGLYVSTVKNKQTSLAEYFLAGKNVPLVVVILSYFSSYAAGPMTGIALETYLYGAQITVSIIFLIPLCSFFLYYLVVPVFYRLQNISMLNYFEIRFGRTVCILAMVASISQMIATGSANLYVAAISIQQVSAVSFWVAATIMTVICIIYSTLGGMRGIVVADAIQAVVMIASALFIFVMATIRSGGPKDIWDINSKNERLHLNTSFNPTIRHTFWTTVLGFNFMLLSHLVTNQSLLQRCLMVPDIKSARKMATIGASMTFVYILIFQVMGVVMFGYLLGCNVVDTGYVKNINQLPPHFAMDILHHYTLLPGIYFSGILCATLSTISSLLNSIPAVIMTYFLKDKPNFSEKKSTLLCKSLVAIFGGIMFLELIVIDNFSNFNQASLILISVISGPMFALYCIGILCPLARHKCVSISFSIAMLFGIWLTVGITLSSHRDPFLPFANCTSIDSLNQTTIDVMPTLSIFNQTQTHTTWNSDNYFPLSKLSYVYISLLGFMVNVICFILITFVFGQEEELQSKLTMDLIPHCVRWIQLKLSRRMRRLLLCDVYSDGEAIVEVEEHLMAN